MTWDGPALVGRRLVVVAPHPDDEVLAAGGLMRWSVEHGTPVVVLAVTDGEASHARSHRITPERLRARRAGERREALARLGVVAAVDRLGHPDQGCAGRVEAISGAVRSMLRAGDVVVAPCHRDRHPDHVAVSEAVRLAAATIVERIWEAPTWALVHHTAPDPTTRLLLDTTAQAAKDHAVRAYRSQLRPLGPDAVDGPVVHPHELAAMVTPSERFCAVAV